MAVRPLPSFWKTTTLSARFRLPSLRSATFSSPETPPVRRVRDRPPFRLEETRTSWPFSRSTSLAERLTEPFTWMPQSRSTVALPLETSAMPMALPVAVLPLAATAPAT